MNAPVQYQTDIILRHVTTGRWLGPSFFGGSNYFATLAHGDIAVFRFVSAQGENVTGSINNGAQVMIRSDENISAESWMGAFSDSEYLLYYTPDGDKTEWTIKATNDGDVRYGEKVNLRNVHYGGEYGFGPSKSSGTILLRQTTLGSDDMNFYVFPLPQPQE